MRVVFDIGHGSNTWPPSKGVKLPNGSSFAEHDFNSAVAVEARRLAEHQGFEVLYTQEPGKASIKIGPRASWVNTEHKHKPILCLISFHANASFVNPNASGWCVFHWYNSTNGKRLAELWAKYATSMLPIEPWNSGILECKPGEWTNFDIVRKPVMPCILIEHFFYTNFDELAKCSTPAYISKSAEVVVKALCEYAGVAYKDPGKDPITEYKDIIQKHVGFSNPNGVWELLDQHQNTEVLYKRWADSYKGIPG